jgi:hypothetical protein
MSVSSPDLLASCAIVLLVVVASASHAVRAALFGPRDEATEDAPTRTVALPVSVRTISVEVLGPIARTVASAGISANAVTAFSLAAGATGGLFLACGHFGLAALAVVLASFGDAVDGLVATRSSSSWAGWRSSSARARSSSRWRSWPCSAPSW